MLLATEGGEHHVETLFMVAYYHHNHGLDVGHTFPVGRAWAPGATCYHFLVSVPYPFGSSLEYLKYESHEIRFLWLLPVYASEVQFRHRDGFEALERLFDKAAFDIYDIDRRPVI